MTTVGDHVYAVVLAGGSGTRFWPKSRHLSPKQLCAIGDGEETMLEITLKRLEGFIPPERRMVVTHKDQYELTKKIIGDKCKVILAEPEARNTAAALALASIEIETVYKGDKKPVMISLHADHVIRKEDEFKKVLGGAVDIAEEGYIALLGIVPQYPETGYGYIEKSSELGGGLPGFKVSSFKEKPDAETAKKYLETGNYFWNAGLFVWRVDTILDELQKYLPKTVDDLRGLVKGSDAGFTKLDAGQFAKTYGQLEKIAIDNAVCEQSDKIAVIAADIGWQDVGSWNALDLCFSADEEKNLLYGDTMMIDSEGTTVDTDGPFVAAIGLKDFVVVCSKGAVLVCPKDRAQEVKKVVENLKSQGRKELL